MADLGLSPAKVSKFKNKSAEIDGHRFASQMEARRYSELRLGTEFDLVPTLPEHAVPERLPD